jgi:hypothetical protein
MENDLYYNLRHLKDFKKITGNDKSIWKIHWPDGGKIKIYCDNHAVCVVPNHDIQLAEYIVSLHNMSNRLIDEVETKYEKA